MEKKYLPFEGESWEKIVDNAFLPDAEIHVFSERYKRRKEKLMKKHTTDKKPVIRKKTIIAIAAAVAVIAAVPTSAMAGARLYNAHVEKTAEYERGLTIELGEQPLSSGEATVPFDESIYNLSFGYVPENLALYDEGPENAQYPSFGKYSDTARQNGITFTFFSIDNENQIITEDIKYVTDEGSYETEDKAAYTFEKEVGRNETWVVFKNTRYAAQLLVSGVSEDELRTVIDNLELVESDNETAHSYDYYRSVEDENTKIDEAEIDENYSESAHMENKEFMQVGDTIDDGGVNVTVSGARIQKNFDGISTDGIVRPFDYSEYADEEGNILDNERTWYKSGDGVNSLDEEVCTETMPMSIVVIDVVYENTGDAPVEYCVCPNLLNIDEKGNVIFPYGGSTDPERKSDTAVDTMGELLTDNMHFSMETTHKTSKNNLVNLRPGEKAEVQLAYAVFDDYLERFDLYFNPDYGWKTLLSLDEALN